MGRLFGTDGVRGIANRELNCRTAYLLGQAAAVFLGPRIVIGRDTRISGPMLEAAAGAGIMSAGGTVLAADVIPTPGVALLVRTLEADGGLVISASHNPPEYNGIKLFDGDGFKLPDAVEDRIERFIADGGLEGGAAVPEGAAGLAAGDAAGCIQPVPDALETYIQHAVDSVLCQGIDLGGLHIALDTGHGAASLTSPEAFRRLGARVTVINDSFDGTDINVGCGSTHLEPLKELLAECGADLGIAHDGDADRVMAVAPDGRELDGDYMAATLAIDMKQRGVLPGNTVVGTVMCNLGFMEAMGKAGIDVVQTAVGDRYVLEEMRAHGFSLGGEQSGHMIMLDHNSTGDGLMTACQYLAALKRCPGGIAAAADVMERFPQVLINVKVADKQAVAQNAAVAAAVDEAERFLGNGGRVLLRPSGTEPLVRVMVEARTATQAQAAAESIATVVRSQLGRC